MRRSHLIGVFKKVGTSFIEPHVVPALRVVRPAYLCLPTLATRSNSRFQRSHMLTTTNYYCTSSLRCSDNEGPNAGNVSANNEKEHNYRRVLELEQQSAKAFQANQLPDALEYAKQCLSFTEQHFDRNHEMYPRAQGLLGLVYKTMHDYDASVAAYKEALQAYRNYYQLAVDLDEPKDIQSKRLAAVAIVLTNIGLAYAAQAGTVGKQTQQHSKPLDPAEIVSRQQELFQFAHQFMQEAYEIRVNRLPMLQHESPVKDPASGAGSPTSNETAFKLDQQVAKYQLASILTNLKRYEEAEALIIDSIQLLTTMSRTEGISQAQQQRFLVYVATALTHYAHLLSALKRFQEADQCFEQSFLTRKQLFGEKHMETLTVITHWMISKASRGDEEGARLLKKQLYTLLDHPDANKL